METKITLLPGDGIGPEITVEAKEGVNGRCQ